YRGGSGYKAYYAQANVNLMKTSDKAKTVKLVRGQLPITLLSEQKPEVVTDNLLKSKGKKVKLGGTSSVIDNVGETPGKQYEVKLTIQEDGHENDWNWINTLYQRIEVQDPKGEKYQFYGSSLGSNGVGSAEFTFTLGQPGNAKLAPPSKL